MASLKEIRNRISSVKSTQQITKAMKMVSAAKLRRAQDAIIHFRPYASQMNKVLSNITASMVGDDFRSIFSEERPPEKVLIIVVTSDRGLCGAFNSNIVKAALAIAQEKYPTQLGQNNVSFLAFGNKGFDALRRRKINVNTDYVTVFHKLQYDFVKEAAEFIFQKFISKEIDRVELVFNEFKNIATQVLRQQQFLPLLSLDGAKSGQKTNQVDYIFEPSKEEIIETLVPKILTMQLYRAILESNASEQGARMMAMDKATENAGELMKELQLNYNRSRQAAITKEILEIVGGAEALKAGSE